VANLSNEDELKNRKDKHDYLKTWLQNFSQTKKLIPIVQRGLETTEWEIDA
jgi:hypothetical protein